MQLCFTTPTDFLYATHLPSEATAFVYKFIKNFPINNCFSYNFPGVQSFSVSWHKSNDNDPPTNASLMLSSFNISSPWPQRAQELAFQSNADNISFRNVCVFFWSSKSFNSNELLNCGSLHVAMRAPSGPQLAAERDMRPPFRPKVRQFHGLTRYAWSVASWCLFASDVRSTPAIS